MIGAHSILAHSATGAHDNVQVSARKMEVMRIIQCLWI